MPHVLNNGVLEIRWDLPLEGYSFSRFDWTGKITELKFRNIPMTVREHTDRVDQNLFGMGLYNEFGIDNALGYVEAKPGEWFHKIGVGALKKTDGPYQFTTAYNIRPAKFYLDVFVDKVLVRCQAAPLSGYAYHLTKEIHLGENRLTINYHLENTGQKTIETDEYVHNFMGVARDRIGKDYLLRFPFELHPKKFRALVNPEDKLLIREKEIAFQDTPEAQFFVSHLNEEQTVPASWELRHLKSGIGIRETLGRSTQKVNLWGWKHVVSPELFQHISVHPGQSASWSRYYEFFTLD